MTGVGCWWMLMLMNFVHVAYCLVWTFLCLGSPGLSQITESQGRIPEVPEVTKKTLGQEMSRHSHGLPRFFFL